MLKKISQTILQSDYVHFIALFLFLLLARFYAYWCGHNNVVANDKVGHFLMHNIYIVIVCCGSVVFLQLTTICISTS